jgi:hypothetical protein
MSEPAKILWTGGWDSTFRVLSVLLMEERSVEPHHIVDTLRQSSLRELRAIGEIRKALDKLSPDAGARFGRLRITVKNDTPEDPAITALWKQLRRRFDIAIEYDWLARWAQLHNLTDLELCLGKV